MSETSAAARPARTAEGPRWVSACVVGAALAPIFVAAPRMFGLLVSAQDEGQLLAYASLMRQGLWPNTDFVYVYGVNNLLLLDAAGEVFGSSLLVERGVGLLVRATIAVLVALTLRRFSGPVAAGAGGAIAALVLVTTALPAYSWLTALAVGLLAVFLASAEPRGSSRRALRTLLPWLLGGLAVGVRLDIAPAVLAGLVASAVFAGGGWGLGARRDWSYRALGLVVGLTPLLFHLAFADNVVRDTISKPVLQSSARRLPLVPADPLVAAFAAVVVVAALTVVVVLVLLLPRARLHAGAYRPLLATGAFGVLLMPQMLQRLDLLHIAYVGCVVVPLAVGALSFASSTTTGVRARRALAGAAVLVAMVGAGLASNESLRTLGVAWHEGLEVARVEVGDRQVIVTERESDSLRELVDAVRRLETPECAGFFQGPGDLRFAPYSDTFLYYLLPDVEPASRFLEFNPGDANAPDSDLADEVRSAGVVVLNPLWTSPYWPGWSEEPAVREPGPDDPNQALSDFVLMGQFGSRQLLASPACAASVGGERDEGTAVPR